MYSLRKVLKSGTETNEFIGARYSLVNNDFDPVGFDKLWDGDPDVYAYINETPLYRDERNYIISSNGALFCNVSYKRRQVDAPAVCEGNSAFLSGTNETIL